MRKVIAFALLLAAAGQAHAAGILIPKEKEVPPLAMVNHKVAIDIEDQVATTRVEQTFRNHTDRQLEATYIFPVPKDASVRKFSMWVGGKEVTGELVEAKKARQIYTRIVQRTLDPGLLEYMDYRMFKLRVFPIPPKGDQKIAFTYTSVVPSDHGLINYTYPLKTDGKAVQTLEKFSIQVTLKSQHTIQNIYSPTHPIMVTRSDDKHAKITFQKNEGALDRNFDLYYQAGDKDVGLTALTHRPTAANKGYFMMLISPRAEFSRGYQVPRDVVFVLDTSGSMRGKRIEQARNALKYCLGNLNKQDRFAIVQFATTVNRYSDQLLPAHEDNITQAKKWVADLEATGGTAINDALSAALQMRTQDKDRTFTLVFFTDGRPTIGETDSGKILKSVLRQNTANTRIFTFGVGDDVNATMLDQMADQSRAVSSYVRESENIEEKVSSLYKKISHPVLTNLKLQVTNGIKLSEVYPPELPDLFHGSQLVVLGRFDGNGAAAVKLTGSMGKENREFVYEMTFPKKSEEETPFVEDLWARRKVGYLLDQIRRNGEKKELVEEVVSLAKRYGITTPYTSYLIVPDEPTPLTAERPPLFRQNLQSAPGGAPVPNLPGFGRGSGKVGVKDFARAVERKGGLAKNRADIEELHFDSAGKSGGAKGAAAEKAVKQASAKKKAYDRARGYFARRKLSEVQGGRLGVDLSVWNNDLRNQSHIKRSAVRRVNNRNVLEVGGVWIDESFQSKMKTVTVKAMSKAYFRLLERHPELRQVFQLGNHLVWVTPAGTALVVDTIEGRTDMTDAEIDGLFKNKKG